MNLKLPPKSAVATQENIKALTDGLTSVIAGHPGAIQMWTFYEVLDEYLGPWREQGYPIGYGKYYCIAFNGNEKLARNPQTKEWVRATTVTLQEQLRDFVVTRFRAGRLAQVSEAELRAFAFSTHPKAYVQGGLTMVALVAPEMIPTIASIPAAQFNPASENFGATIREVFATLEIVLPQAAGTLIAAAMPVHSGLLRTAVLRSQQNMLQDLAFDRWIGDARRQIDSGRLDRIASLNQLTAKLNATQFKDQGFASAARQVIEAADNRKRKVARYYRDQIQKNPRLATSIDKLDPEWRRW